MSIFGVIGFAKGVIVDSIAVLWPVNYHVSPEDAERAKAACEEQRDEFLAAIDPLRELHYELTRDLKRAKRTKRLPRGEARVLEASLVKRLGETMHKEAEIVARYTNSMLDPMFPTTSGKFSASDIVYWVIEFREDPRDRPAIDIMKARAALHGIEDAEEQESNDLDSPGWDS